MASLVSIDTASAPSLAQAEPSSIGIGSEYWTPEGEGEFKNGFVLGIEEQEHQRADEGNGDDVGTIILPCIVFAEQVGGDYKQWSNGSKRLVGVIEDAISKGVIECGKTPLRITYIGKKRNVTNQFKSDAWDIRTLQVN